MTIETRLGDTLATVFTVTYEGGASDGLAFDLTGATLEAVAKRRGVSVTGAAVVSDGPAGEAEITFAAGDLSAAGEWEFQVRATSSGVTQTIYAGEIRVLGSVF